MAISLVKHREVEANGKVYSYFEDARGTDLLVYKRTGPHSFDFIKRLYIPKQRINSDKTVSRVVSRYFFYCHCNKMHTYVGINVDTQCPKCGSYLWSIVAVAIKEYGARARLSPVDLLIFGPGYLPL